MTASNSNMSELARLVDFGRRWYPFGGGAAEEIQRTFGVTQVQYFRQLHQILVENPPSDLRGDVIAKMLRVCRMRIWQST